MDFAPSLTVWQWLIPVGAAAAVAATYFLKTRRKPVLVPSTYLWRRTVEDHRVNAFWQRLRSSALLILQLAAIAAAVAALLRPSWHGFALRGGRYVFLLDRSASMSATDVAPSRLEEAKRRALALVEQMRDGDVAMVVSFAGAANIEQSFTDNRARLRRAVESIRPSHESASFDEVLRICSGSVVRGRRPGDSSEVADDETSASGPTVEPAQVFLFSDGKLAETRAGGEAARELAQLNPTFIPIGTAEAANVGVTGFAVRRNDATGTAQALAKVRNFATAARNIECELHIDGKRFDVRRMQLDVGARHDVLFTVAAAPDGAWELKIASAATAQAADVFADDDRAWTVLAPRQKTRVLVATPGNRFLESSLKTDEALHWCEAIIRAPAYLQTAEYERQAGSGGFDAVIYDRCSPKVSPSSSTLYFGALPPLAGWKADAAVEAPQVIDAAQAHPLMQNTRPAEVLIAEATPIVGPSGTQMLLDSDRGVLGAIAPRGPFEDAVLGFGVLGAEGLQTNWPLIDGAGFEQFVLNAVQYFGRAAGGAEQAAARPGEPLRFHLADAAKEARLTLPDGTATTLARGAQGDFIFYDTRLPGVYRLAGGSAVAVNLFDERESDVALAAEPKLRLGNEEITTEIRRETASQESWRPFVLVVLALLCGEWYIYGTQSRGRRRSEGMSAA